MNLQRKKKVLFLITKSNWGGAQRYVYDIATHLDSSEFEPVVALGGSGDLATMLSHAGVRVISVPTLTNTLAFRPALATLRDLMALCRSERPDILHVNSSVAGLLGTLAGRMTRVPQIIFTSHGWAFNEDRPWWQKIVIKFLHWLTVLLSHRTIAVSNGVLKQMHWPGAWRKMKVINPGRTIGVMYSRSEAREKICDFFPHLLPHHHDPWLVCVAELHPIKRHHILFKAMQDVVAKNSHARLACVGEGNEREKLETLIRELGLTENVFLLGQLPEAARFLKAFDMFVLASKSESYGYVLHEAGLAELPVVATNVGGVTDIVTSGVSGTLVPPDRTLNLELAINTYLSDPVLSNAHGQNLYEAMTTRTLEKMVRQTAFLYTKT